MIDFEQIARDACAGDALRPGVRDDAVIYAIAKALEAYHRELMRTEGPSTPPILPPALPPAWAAALVALSPLGGRAYD